MSFQALSAERFSSNIKTSGSKIQNRNGISRRTMRATATLNEGSKETVSEPLTSRQELAGDR